ANSPESQNPPKKARPLHPKNNSGQPACQNHADPPTPLPNGSRTENSQEPKQETGIRTVTTQPQKQKCTYPNIWTTPRTSNTSDTQGDFSPISLCYGNFSHALQYRNKTQ
ncbi:hypothetical protein XENOCAPTIV_001403, partial [Xenoophorus captivus]